MSRIDREVTDLLAERRFEAQRPEAEPSPPRAPSLAEDMAFAAGSAVLFLVCNTALPVYGGIGAAASIPALNRLRMKFGTPSESARVRALEEVERMCALRQVPDAAWNGWLPWRRLCAGEKIEVPKDLPHPEVAGFEFTRWASDVGQAGDWVYSLADGSRLHAHEYPDGRIVVHLDALDPARGPGTATIHWLSETPEGNIAFVVLAAGLAFGAWKLVDAGEL